MERAMSEEERADLLNHVLNADRTLLGVRLARMCLDNDIPIKDVAKYIRAHRCVVYGWVTRKTKVPKRYASKVEDILERLL